MKRALLASMLVSAAATTACSEHVVAVPRRTPPAASSTASPPVAAGTPAIPFAGTSPGTPPPPTPMPRPGVNTPPVPPATLTCAPIATPVSPIPWVPPNPLHQPVCTPQEASIVATCFTLGGQYCNALPNISPQCQTCAVVPGNSPRYGALIQVDPSRPAELNVEGCVSALTGDGSATSCGARLLAESVCETNACNHCSTDAEFDQCNRAAASTTCASQAAAAACADAPLATCVQGKSRVEQATHLVALFCMS